MSKDAGIAEFRFLNKKYEIQITYGFARRVLQKEFDINLLNLFDGPNLDTLITKLSLNDEFLLDIWWYFIKEDFNDKEACIDKLTPDDVTAFREALWAAIMNFFDPTRRAMLLEIKNHTKTLMMDNIQSLIKTSMEKLSDNGLSNTSEKQESTQEA